MVNVFIADGIPTSSAWYRDPCTRLTLDSAIVAHLFYIRPQSTHCWQGIDSRALSMFLLPADDNTSVVNVEATLFATFFKYLNL